MIAVYARQSVDRPDSISIESQIEFCLFEVRGEAYRLYQDCGYSGKNMERPAFREMMADLTAGLISKVVVYKLDRISRSILDFSGMMERFGQFGVEFVSASEKFDTSSPMGRAMLNICVVFAQLERETIQKRVADTYASRSQKSFYMGGRLPFGFRLESTVLGAAKRKRMSCS
ncbi:MAG: recombinase family protein [Clostridiales bacterium]